MSAAAAPSGWLAALLSGLQVGPPADTGHGRVSAEGVSWRPDGQGGGVLAVDRLVVADLAASWGAYRLSVAELQVVSATLAWQPASPGGSPLRWAAAEAVLTGVAVEGPLRPLPTVDPAARADAAAAAAATPPGGDLGPLATADGSLRARVTDAQFLFDADITVPLSRGEVDFNAATVAHVGPDSRMGVSRLGVYVDSGPGRTYLYQFATAPASGVTFERRDALLGAFVADRGRLALQPFAEALLRQSVDATLGGLTDPARTLLGRTALQGEVHLGDAALRVGGVETHLAGRAAGHNVVRLQAKAVGGGLSVEMATLRGMDTRLALGHHAIVLDEVGGGVRASVTRVADGPWVTLAADRLHIRGCRGAPPGDGA